MIYLLTASGFLLIASIFCIALVFVLYPMTLVLLRRRATPLPAISADSPLPTVSLLIVARNAEDMIGDKLDNSFALDYPADRLEVVVFSDGSTDRTEEFVRAHAAGGERLRFLSSRSHQGKTNGINAGMASCTGDIVVLSDVDAMLGDNALMKLVAHFADPDVGGVCGQRAISADTARMKDAQRRYIGVDSWIKILESRGGSISSNDGKLYALRRRLFKPIAPAVTDDLYTALTVIEQHYRFVFEPEAVASIRVPSRSQGHELQRRRRIVSRSLRGIFIKRRLLNPMEYGFYSISLFCNKVMRRAMPAFLVLLLATSLHLAAYSKAVAALLALQLVFYGLAGSYVILERLGGGGLRKLASVAYYFCVGNFGTLMGVLDFLRGERITQWDPVKRDAPS